MESSSNDVVVVRGFTLIELIVVLFLIIVLTTITITSQTNYNRSLIITNTAYTVALSIRESQSLGLSSRNFKGTQNAGYGVNFHKATNDKYIIFADIDGPLSNPPYQAYALCPTGTANTPEFKPGNCLYDSTGEILKTYSLNKGFRIHNFCGLRTTNNALACGSSDAWPSMNITFIRPNTEAVISMINSGNNLAYPMKCAVIWIAPPNGTATNMKCIVVAQTGQVSVPQTCPAANLVNPATGVAECP